MEHDGAMTDGSEFYEDDEPIENIRAAFKRGEPVLTARPRTDVNQRAAGIVGAVAARTEAEELPRLKLLITPEMHIQRQNVRIVSYSATPVPAASTK
jgi:hypothetical protein